MAAPPIDVALRCDLPVGVVRWNGPEPWLTVVVKASFSLAGDDVWLAPEQAPLTGDVPSPIAEGELSAASDFVPHKPRADVMLVGAAHAGEMVWAIPAAFAIGALRRELYAVASAPSLAIPLSEVYLRSGPGPEAAAVRVGPRSPRSAERAWFAGGDYRFYNAAPPEQQVEAIAEDAIVELRGLLRGAPYRRVALPGMRPRVHVVDQSGRSRVLGPVALRCDTLVIDTDAATCTLTWRGLCDLGGVARPCLLVGFDALGAAPSEAELRDDLSRAAWTVAVEAPGEAAPEAPREVQEETIVPAPPSLSGSVRLGGFQLGMRPPEVPVAPLVPVAPVAPLVPVAPAIVIPEPPPAIAISAPEPPRRGGLSLEVFAAVQAAIWSRRVPLAEALAAHGIDEIAWRAGAPALLADLAAEGRADRLLDLSARLRRETGAA
jgi:hypothetical protein